MKLFLDTANYSEIERWHAAGIVDGVTTNPTHLSKEGKNPTQQVRKICQLIAPGLVSIEVTQQEPAAVYKQALEIAKIADNVLVKIPCHVQYYPVIKRLVNEGIALNITLVFTVIQGLMMSKLGVEYISPFIGRWDDIDVDGTAMLFEFRHMLDEYVFETKLLAASLRHTRHVHAAIAAGADAATVPVDVLAKALDHPLTDKGIALFNADWQKLGVEQFP